MLREGLQTGAERPVLCDCDQAAAAAAVVTKIHSSQTFLRCDIIIPDISYYNIKALVLCIAIFINCFALVNNQVWRRGSLRMLLNTVACWVIESLSMYMNK